MTTQQVGGGNFGPPRNGNTNGITRINTSTITPGGNTASIGSLSRISTNISIYGQGQGQQQQVQQQQQQQQQVQPRTPSFVPPGFTPNPNSNAHVTQGGFSGGYTARGQEFGGQSAPMPIGTYSNQVTATASDNPFTPQSVETTTMGNQITTHSQAVSGTGILTSTTTSGNPFIPSRAVSGTGISTTTTRYVQSGGVNAATASDISRNAGGLSSSTNAIGAIQVTAINNIQSNSNSHSQVMTPMHSGSLQSSFSGIMYNTQSNAGTTTSVSFNTGGEVHVLCNLKLCVCLN